MSPARRRAVTFLGVLAVAASLGCPVPIADPATEARIVNDSPNPIDVELTMHAEKTGLDPLDPEAVCSWLREFANGERVEVVKEHVDTLTGTYRIAPAGFLVVHAAMGRAPQFVFHRLAMTDGVQTLTLRNEADISERFMEEDNGRYAFRVSSVFDSEER